MSQSISDGSTIAGAVQWTTTPPAGTVTKVDFSVDGTNKFTDSSAPFVFNGDGNALDTTTLSDGSHTFKVTASYQDGTTAASSVTATVANASVSPPPKGGYFTLQAPGSWSSLPSGAACATAVHRSPWEPRAANYKRNHVTPDASAVHAAFAARPLAVDNNYDSRWDTWLLPRVDGQFTGTTDEIFQWAACKWGLSDDMLRAIAVRESTWYEYLTYPSGRCVIDWGCGDMITSPNADTVKYCNAIASSGGYDYQKDFGAGSVRRPSRSSASCPGRHRPGARCRTTRTGRSRSTATPPPSRSTISLRSSAGATKAGSIGWAARTRQGHLGLRRRLVRRRLAQQ